MKTCKVPSKTFLCGEYATLMGGPSVLLTAAPYFQCGFLSKQDEAHGSASSGEFIGEFLSEALHCKSPAGKWMDLYSEVFSQKSCFFYDPHKGQGGFGASTAQFLLVYLLSADSPSLEELSDISSLETGSLLDAYRSMAWSGVGIPPSGVDLIAQLFGTYIDEGNTDNGDHGDKSAIFFDSCQGDSPYSQLSWPFSNMGYLILRTGKKLSTHEHLNSLLLGDVNDFTEVVLELQKSLREGLDDLFLGSIKKYGDLLSERNWVAAYTKELLSFIKNERGVLAAKGCGAMGADTILVFFANDYKESLLELFSSKDLPIVAMGGV